MAIVYVTQEPPPVKTDAGRAFKDMSSAVQYGRLHYVFPAALDRVDDPLRHALRQLEHFKAGEDALCYAGGDALALAFSVLALRYRGHGSVTFLRWERPRDSIGNRRAGGFYMPTQLALTERKKHDRPVCG